MNASFSLKLQISDLLFRFHLTKVIVLEIKLELILKFI